MPSPPDHANVFVDADNAGNKENDQSHTGLVSIITNSPSIWFSKTLLSNFRVNVKQNLTISLASTAFYPPIITGSCYLNEEYSVAYEGSIELL
jgi:hypothetical protein